MTEMTKEVLIAACKNHGGYAAPRLNDQLFLQCRGFIGIKNLEDYINLKVLWLEQNAISELTGLSALQKLVSLFVQNNIITSLSQLSTLENLRVLNISHNYITSLDGLAAACPLLETLQASHNYLTSLNSCSDLWKLQKTLTSVDISFNKIEVEECNLAPLDFFAQLPNVSVIYFHGNPATRSLQGYRRAMILRLPQLTYLDERPVFVEERRLVEAWGAGGEEAETREREAIRSEKRAHLENCVRVLTDRMEENREVRDRLTRQWEARRDEELRRHEASRRRVLEERQSAADDEARGRAVIAAAEAEEREAIASAETTAEAAARQREEAAARQKEEAAARQKEEAAARQKEEAAARQREEAAARQREEAAEVPAGVPDEPLAAAVPTDDDMMEEVGDSIRRVLGPLGGGAVSRTALKMERAIGTVAARLSAEQSRVDVWTRFAQWEARSKR